MCVCVYANTYLWDSDTGPPGRFDFSLSPPKQTLRHKGQKLLCSRYGFSACWWVVTIHTQAHVHTAIGTRAHSYRRSYPARLNRAVYVARSCCGSWRQTVSHKCKKQHTWRRHTQTLGSTLGDCGRIQGFPPHTLPLWRVHFLPSSRMGSLVRFCSHCYSLELTLKWI